MPGAVYDLAWEDLACMAWEDWLAIVQDNLPKRKASMLVVVRGRRGAG